MFQPENNIQQPPKKSFLCASRQSDHGLRGGVFDQFFGPFGAESGVPTGTGGELVVADHHLMNFLTSSVARCHKFHNLLVKSAKINSKTIKN